VPTGWLPESLRIASGWLQGGCKPLTSRRDKKAPARVSPAGAVD